MTPLNATAHAVSPSEAEPVDHSETITQAALEMAAHDARARGGPGREPDAREALGPGLGRAGPDPGSPAR